jgi:hypothetical protein
VHYTTLELPAGRLRSLFAITSNVNSYVYGRVYFPVRSNRLKDIGKFIGATELLSRVVYGDSRGVLLHPEPILKGHALHDLWQVMGGS